MAKQLKKYVRYDGNRQLVPGSMIERYTQPKGKFEELLSPDPNECCIPLPQTQSNREGWGVYVNGNLEYHFPTYYLVDSYQPPTETGQLVMPIHSAQVASTYPGRTGTVPSQPQGAVQMYFSMVDANNIDWKNTTFTNYLSGAFPGGNVVFCLKQNGVSVEYILNSFYSFPAGWSTPFTTTPGLDSFYHDEVFGTNLATTMTLRYQSMNGVAFNTKDPIQLNIYFI